DLILRENYDSVIAMKDLNEALERIDSSFQFTLAGRPDKGLPQYQENWRLYRRHLQTEESNITLEGEDELVAQLVELTQRYRRQGDAFYQAPLGGTFAAGGLGPVQGLPWLAVALDQDRHRLLYFDKAGLLETFNEIKTVSGWIAQINH